MPQIKPIRVHSCSPSHEKFPATNLILGKPWKCRDQGEKRAFVVLDLGEPTLINGIDIGNEHSCFIEVLVGNQGDAESDFQQLLLTSSFQTPAESRNSENTNRVRCFSKTAFVENTANKKWSLVQLVCTQPFNSRVQYGVSFVTIYSAEEKKVLPKEAPPSSAPEVVVEKKRTLFSLREDSPDEDSDTASSSLFSRWKQSKQGNGSGSPVTTAAAIRDARGSVGERRSPLLLTPTAAAAKKRPSTDSATTPLLDRNRNNLLYDDEDEKPGDEKLEKLIEKDQKRAEEILKKDHNKKPSERTKPETATPAKKFKFSEKKLDEDKPDKPATSKPPSPPATKPQRPKKFKPFRKLLEGVVLTISGIQNPERANLRSKALEMGAKYKGDWDDSCTHLICAFRNTPKYNQVQGVGKIVKKDWVFKCYENKRHIPWRRFALDNKEADKSESEDEIWDEAEKTTEEESVAVVQHDPELANSSPKKAAGTDEQDDDILMIYDQKEDAPVVICDSGSDTEDEIEKVRSESKAAAKEKSPEKAEKSCESSGGFLSGKKFYLDEDNGAVKIIKCNSIITKFGGEVIESREASDFWIKSKAPASEFLNKPNLPVVRPLWLEECAEMECILPIKRYTY